MRIPCLAAVLALTACVGNGRPAGSTSNGHGKADDYACPVDFDADAITSAIERAGSCGVAADLAEVCAFGSSLDVQFVASASALCERGYGAMTTDARRAYNALLGQCVDKYENESGTMYRSFAAFCQLEVTRLFTTLFPEPEYAEPAVPFTMDCPVAFDADVIESAISRASSCGNAADIASACAFGSSIDVQFSAAASQLCLDETGAPTGINAEIYDGLIGACGATMHDDGGTLSLSIAAMCRLQVDVVFNTLAREIE